MNDLTIGRPLRVILSFTLPLVAGSILQLAYSFADSMIVGRTLGEEAFAAVGATGSITFFVLGFAQGLTSGFSVILSQRFGAKDTEGVKRFFVSGLILSVAVALILTLFSLLFLKQILTIMQTPTELMDLSYQFLQAILSGILATILYNYLSSAIRALGDSRTPLFALIIAVLINVILDFVFILYFGWGVFGAGFATVLSQCFSVIFLYCHILKHIPQLGIKRSDLLLKAADVKVLLNMGLPMGFQMSIIAIGSMMVQYALNQLGTQAVAAQTIASRTDQLAMSPMVNLGLAVSTFTAQNYGARRYDRLFEGLKESLMVSVGWSIVFVIILLSGHRFFSSLFLPDGSPQIYDLALTYYIINGLCYWILAILFTVRGFIQGLGKSFAPTLAGVMELLMRSIVAISGLRYLGFAGVVAAHPAAWIGSVIVLIPTTLIVYKSLRKKMSPLRD